MEIPKSIAVIGEGETEWFYFDSLRVACRYPFKIAPDIPQHSDIPHMAKMAEQYVSKDYDIVVCLVDMDRLLLHRKELETYKQIKAKSSKRILWIETNPCTEFWFLLHFMPELAVKYYKTCDEVILELQKYMPGYEKTVRYFRKTKLYEYLRVNGDLDRAMKYSKQLSALSESSPEDKVAYSQIHHVIELLSQWADSSSSDKGLKSEFCERNGEVESKIIDFLANSYSSDAKSISKAIGLGQSRITFYLKRLIEKGDVVCTDGWKKSYRLANPKKP